MIQSLAAFSNTPHYVGAARPTPLSLPTPPATVPLDAAVLSGAPPAAEGASTGKKIINAAAYGLAGTFVGGIAGTVLTTAIVSSLVSPEEGLGILAVGLMGGAACAVGGGIGGAVVGWRNA